MATIAELNIRLGVIYKDLDSGLKQVERRLQASGRRLSSLGNDLTLAISAPLAALSAGAIQQAGELESLKLAMRSTFETAGRSIKEADAELNALRKSALAPGLDFEQAVKASIRLQGVEYSAEQARKAIEQMANAIALTGGTAANLDSVTVQFSQMIAKGKVLSQDLRIIQENMPIISKLMQQAFGTRNAEALQNMGISGREFVDKITQAAATLPRVEGGIKNAIVNAGANARQAMAELGDAINKAFNVTGLLDRFSGALAGAVEWFKNLDSGVQKTIVQVGAFAIALGPAIKLIGVLKLTAAQGVDIMRDIAGAIKTAASGALSAVDKFGKLSTAMKITTLGALVAGVTALYFAFQYLSENISLTSAEAKALQDVNKQAAASIAKEKSEIDLLIGVLNDENATRAQKEEALKKLQAISPQYFGSLKEENGLILGLKDSYDKYIEALLTSAKAAAAREKLVDIERRLLEITQDRQKLDQSSGGSVRGLAFANLEKQRQLSNLKDEEDALGRQKKALAGLIVETESQKTALNGATAAQTTYTHSTKEAADAAKKAQKDEQDRFKALRDFWSKPVSVNIEAAVPKLPTVGLPDITAPLDFGPTINQLVDGLGAINSLTGGLQDMVATGITPAQATMKALGEDSQQFSDIYDQIVKNMSENGTLLQNVVLGIGDAMSQAAEAGATSFAELGKAAAAAAAKIVRAWIQQGVAAAVAKALSGLPFPLNLAAGAIAGAAAGALFNKAISAIGIPALAQGGVIDKPTFALMGEYTGAKTNPEIVTPENKLRSIFKESGGGLGGELTAVVRGDDLQFILRKAQAREARRG